MAKNNDILRPFARSIFAKVRALKELELTKSQESHLFESIPDEKIKED